MGALVAFGLGSVVGFLIARQLLRADYDSRSRIDQVALDCARQRIRDLTDDRARLEAKAEFYRSHHGGAGGYAQPPLINSRGPSLLN